MRWMSECLQGSRSLRKLAQIHEFMHTSFWGSEKGFLQDEQHSSWIMGFHDYQQSLEQSIVTAFHMLAGLGLLRYSLETLESNHSINEMDELDSPSCISSGSFTHLSPFQARKDLSATSSLHNAIEEVSEPAEGWNARLLSTYAHNSSTRRARSALLQLLE